MGLEKPIVIDIMRIQNMREMQLGMMFMLHFPMQSILNLFKSIMDNYNYPMGADTKDAPWNQVNNPERKIEVTVSITLSKTVKVRVSDYEVTDFGIDEDGMHYEDIDYSNCDLKSAVEEQIVLPQDAYRFITSSGNKSVKEELKGWNMDDFEVVLS